MIYKKGEKMTYDEAIKVLRKEKWKASPEAPVPQWLIDKNDEDAIRDFKKSNAMKYEALDIAIDCIKTVKYFTQVKGKAQHDAGEET